MKYPILYPQDATDFFTMGLGPVKFKEATVEQVRNGLFIFNGKISTDEPIYPLVLNDYLIKADADHALKDQRFRIKRIVANHKGYAEIYAEHISYLASELSLKPLVRVSGSASIAINQWKNGIIEPNPLVVDSDVTTYGSTEWRVDKIDSPMEALGGKEGSMLDVWGGEYRFDNYHISLLKKRGTTANTVLSYGRNITSLEQEKNISNVYNSIRPFAIYNDDNDVEQVVTLTNHFVDVENIANYPNRRSLSVDFSSEFKHDEIPTQARLTALAKEYITANQVGIPKVSIRVSFLDLAKSADYHEYKHLETLNLCDEVRVHYPKLGINTTAKVVRTVWNVLTESYDEIEIGEKRTSLSSQINDQNKVINEINTQTNYAIISANGKNTTFYGLYGSDGLGEPIATKVGDNWFKPNGEYEDYLVWTGTIWKFLMSTQKLNEIEEKIEQAEKDIVETDEKAQKGLDKAEEAIIKAGFANDAVEIAIEQSADAVSQAEQAMQSATDLLGQVTEIEGMLTTVESVIDELNGQMALKVNTTDFNTLTGIVDSHTTQIGVNSSQIALKANKDYVDTINNQVESVYTELTVQAGEIIGLNTKTDGLVTEFGQMQSSFDTFRVTLGEVQTGLNGAVKATVVEYYLSTSLTSATGGSWVTAAPPWTAGKYMWSRTKITYVNGVTSYTPATCIAGAQGQQGTQGAPGTPGQKGEQGNTGNTGATGKSVSSIIPQYAMTTSKTTAPTTGWTTTAPTWIEGRYIWTRSQINWTNPTSTTYTTPVVDSALDAVATKYSDLQIKVDGIQSTVSRIDGDYATNTKVNQLADQWTQTTNLANGHTGQISNLGTQIDLRLTQAQVDASILSDKTIKDTRNDNQTPAWYYTNHPRQTVQEFKTKAAIGLTQASGTYAALTTEVSWSGTSGGAIEQTAKADDGVYQRRGTSTWSAWSKVADTSNVLAQINLSTEGVQIHGKKVQITGETYIENAVIKTAHIADLAVSGAKIANASISSAKIISLDASKIVGETIIGINYRNPFTFWYDGKQFTGETTVNNGGINQHGSASDGTQVSLTLTGGGLKTQYGIGSTNISPARIEFISKNGTESLLHYSDSESVLYTSSYVGGGLGAYRIRNGMEEFKSLLKAETDWSGYNAVIIQGNLKANDINFPNGSFMYDNASKDLFVSAPRHLYLRTNGVNVIDLDPITSQIRTYLNIDMNYKNLWNVANITQTSDERLKTNIVDTHFGGVEWTMRQRVVDYDWDLNNPVNDNKPVGRQFGIIAQQAEEFAITNEQTGYLSVSSLDLINIGIKTDQEIIIKLRGQKEEIKNLKQKVQELENQVKVLQMAG